MRGLLIFLPVALLPLALHADIAQVPFQFSASLQTGALAGTAFSGTASYGSEGFTGVGKEYLSLTSLDFSLLGYRFTAADINQGGQAILQDGKLSYFTAAFFLFSGSSPVDDIAFGFGGPGIIGYSTPPGFNFGSGTYEIVTGSPEPSTMILCSIAFCVMALFRWRNHARSR